MKPRHLPASDITHVPVGRKLVPATELNRICRLANRGELSRVSLVRRSRLLGLSPLQLQKAAIRFAKQRGLRGAATALVGITPRVTIPRSFGPRPEAVLRLAVLDLIGKASTGKRETVERALQRLSRSTGKTPPDLLDRAIQAARELNTESLPALLRLKETQVDGL